MTATQSEWSRAVRKALVQTLAQPSAQRHAQDCGFHLKEEHLDAMVADLIPEAILKDMRPARAGGKGRRSALAIPKG